jgi:predicted phage-related endonuclease
MQQSRQNIQIDRRHFIGGSDARIIMGQDEKALIRLWQEKRGEVGPEDLSANLIVQLGVVTEDLNRAWYERNTGHAVTAVQTKVKHPVLSFLAAALDGMVTETGAVYEAAGVIRFRDVLKSIHLKYVFDAAHCQSCLFTRN